MARSERVTVMERSPQMQRRTFLRANDMAEHEIAELDAEYEAAERAWKPAGIVCLDAEPEVTHERMLARGREFEVRGASLEYARKLHALQAEAIASISRELPDIPVHVVPCDAPAHEVLKRILECVDAISGRRAR
jgi:deoxyadenosine/deoxycytidine kinase